MPGAQTLLTDIFVSGVEEGVCLKLTGSPCCKAVLIGYTQKRKEIYLFHKC